MPPSSTLGLKSTTHPDYYQQHGNTNHKLRTRDPNLQRRLSRGSAIHVSIVEEEEKGDYSREDDGGDGAEEAFGVCV